MNKSSSWQIVYKSMLQIPIYQKCDNVVFLPYMLCFFLTFSYQQLEWKGKLSYNTKLWSMKEKNGVEGYNALFIQLVEKNGTKSMVGINLNCANQHYNNYNHIRHNIECQN